MIAYLKEKKCGLKQVHNRDISFSSLEVIIKHKRWIVFFIHPEYHSISDSFHCQLSLA